MKEYKILGRGTVEVNGQQVMLESAVVASNISLIEGILNALAKDGWELVSLQSPYIFVRDIPSEVLK